MLEGLVHAAMVILGTLLAVVLLYLSVRLAGKAWYRSKREEEGGATYKINSMNKTMKGR